MVLTLTALTSQAEEPPIRKVISSGICHDPSSPNYSQITAYKPYATMAACVASGGQPRKGPSEIPAAPAKATGKALYDSDDPTIIKKSRKNICYDSTNGRCTKIVHYSAYARIEDCLADGGKRPQ